MVLISFSLILEGLIHYLSPFKLRCVCPDECWLKDIPIRELRFIPSNGQWQIEYVHLALEKPRSSCKLQPDRVLGLDPGINNLLAATSNCGHGFVIDGKPLKAKNQWYNKAKSYYQAILDKAKGENTGIQSKRIRQLIIKRNHFVRNFISFEVF